MDLTETWSQIDKLVNSLAPLIDEVDASLKIFQSERLGRKM